ncbi:MAG: N-acetylglucosamine-6-phosphate deacetylase [Clostridia bacterium]|nr:N-acetylglucosamine-6-phosphate deacetylase [Clostridia bacterium]
MKRIKSDRILLDNALFDGFIYFEGGKILSVSTEEKEVLEEYDFTGYFVSPGFVDIHTHGGAGFPFEGEVDDIVGACLFHLKHGTTSICPTISASVIEDMARSVENVSKAMADNRVKGTIIGAHLEGPYLSREQAGAQCASFIQPPKREEYLPLLEKFSSAIARWSYAPENDVGEVFAKDLKQYGIVASAGHTNATLEDMERAMENGCSLVTHLYSCTSTITRHQGFRKLGVIETAYLLDDLFVEIICDGKHLPPELIRLIYKIKGADKIALVTDSLSLAGSDVTHGFMQKTEFIIEDGVCKLMDRSAFAGSIATSDALVRVAVKEAGISLSDAVKMMTKTPSRIMGLESKGEIKEGLDADFAIFDDNISIQKVFALGEEIL